MRAAVIFELVSSYVNARSCPRGRNLINIHKGSGYNLSTTRKSQSWLSETGLTIFGILVVEKCNVVYGSLQAIRNKSSNSTPNTVTHKFHRHLVDINRPDINGNWAYHMKIRMPNRNANHTLYTREKLQRQQNQETAQYPEIAVICHLLFDIQEVRGLVVLLESFQLSNRFLSLFPCPFHPTPTRTHRGECSGQLVAATHIHNYLVVGEMANGMLDNLSERS